MRRGPARPVQQVKVVVPAHDEELLLPDCLRALALAVRRSPLPVEVIVVADACTDGTARLARAAGSTVLEVDFGNVGLTRAAGTGAAIGSGGSRDLLVLCTDADSTVPPDWILRHVGHVTEGADLVVGTVRPTNWQDWPCTVAREYRRRYRSGVRGRTHRHVHGANLGVLAAGYLELGGFSGLATGEDVHLVQAAHRAGLRVVFATDLAVRTSTRVVGRAPAGFSAHLAGLYMTDSQIVEA